MALWFDVRPSLLRIARRPKHSGPRWRKPWGYTPWDRRGSPIIPTFMASFPEVSSPDSERWVDLQARLLLPVRVLASLFRPVSSRKWPRRMGRWAVDSYFGEYEASPYKPTFDDWFDPLRRLRRVVYAKAPITGAAVIAYL